MVCLFHTRCISHVSYGKVCIKVEHTSDYPVTLEKNHDNLIPHGRILRPHITREWNEDGRTIAAKESFSRNIAKLWNQAPTNIKVANTLPIVKILVNNVKQYQVPV